MPLPCHGQGRYSGDSVQESALEPTGPESRPRVQPLEGSAQDPEQGGSAALRSPGRGPPQLVNGPWSPSHPVSEASPAQGASYRQQCWWPGNLPRPCFSPPPNALSAEASGELVPSTQLAHGGRTPRPAAGSSSCPIPSLLTVSAPACRGHAHTGWAHLAGAMPPDHPGQCPWRGEHSPAWKSPRNTGCHRALARSGPGI